VKKLTMAVAVAVAMLFGSAATAQAESGAMIGGARLALNYSALYASTTYANYVAGYGGLGFEGGPIGRFAIVEGQMGLNFGANFVYRSVYNYDAWYYSSAFESSEMTVAVPILFEISAATFGLRSSDIYELVFIQLGVQADYAFGYSETYGGKAVDNNYFERENFGFGLVIGAVGYFNSHVSLDVRYYYAFTNYYKDISRWSPYTASLGLSFFL